MEISKKAIAAIFALMLPISMTGGCGNQTESEQPASADGQTSDTQVRTRIRKTIPAMTMGLRWRVGCLDSAMGIPT